MNEREKLVTLIMESVGGCARHWAEVIADHLLANGVVVPPCKVGQSVWFIAKRENDDKLFVFDGYVGCIDLRNGWKHVVIHWTDHQDNYRHIVAFDDFGKTVFLTREDAEKALEGRSKP